MMSDREIFHFMLESYDVTAMLADLGTGKLIPKEIEIDAEFVTEFAEKVQCLRRGVPAKDQRVGIFSSVNAPYAMTLKGDRLDEPLIFVHTRKGKGILALDDTGTNYLLADGQHRLARAYLDGRVTPLKAYKLSKVQSRKYRL